MEYSISDYVIVYTNEVKRIEFIELICGVQIFYMSDKTSFAYCQILRCANKDEIDRDLINKMGNQFLNYLYSQEDLIFESVGRYMKKKLGY